MIVTRLVKKFPASYTTRKFIIVFAIVSPPSLISSR